MAQDLPLPQVLSQEPALVLPPRDRHRRGCAVVPRRSPDANPSRRRVRERDPR